MLGVLRTPSQEPFDIPPDGTIADLKLASFSEMIRLGNEQERESGFVLNWTAVAFV